MMDFRFLERAANKSDFLELIQNGSRILFLPKRDLNETPNSH